MRMGLSVLICLRLRWRGKAELGWIAEGNGGFDGLLTGTGDYVVRAELDGSICDDGVGGPAVKSGQGCGERRGFGRAASSVGLRIRDASLTTLEVDSPFGRRSQIAAGVTR